MKAKTNGRKKKRDGGAFFLTSDERVENGLREDFAVRSHEGLDLSLLALRGLEHRLSRQGPQLCQRCRPTAPPSKLGAEGDPRGQIRGWVRVSVLLPLRAAAAALGDGPVEEPGRERRA